MTAIEQLVKHYPAFARIELDDNSISVTIPEEGESIDQFNILFIEGYKVTCQSWATASTSFCERYGVVDEINILLIYTPT